MTDIRNKTRLLESENHQHNIRSDQKLRIYIEINIS